MMEKVQEGEVGEGKKKEHMASLRKKE